MAVGAILLAAGRGTRFGGAKLAADLCGMPVARHAAKALHALPLDARIAVVSDATPAISDLGFRLVTLAPAGAPLSRSIALGIAAAEELAVDAVLIALADMPLVPTAHFMRLLETFDGDVLGTRSGHAMPPAMFGRRHFDALKHLDADAGAREMLASAPAIALDAMRALDIDTPQDLEAARNFLSGGLGASACRR